MKRLLVIGLIAVFAVILGVSQLSFNQSEDVSATIQAQDIKEVKSEEVREEEKEEEPEVEMEIDVNDNFADWIAAAKSVIEDGLLDPRIEQTDYDEGFRYYLEAEAIEELHQKKEADLTDEETETEIGKAIEQDLDNLATLCTMLEHFQFDRTSELGENGEAVEAIEQHEEWRDIPEDMRIAYAQIEMIIHDLDIAIHHNGKGETYGVTHTLDGENVEDLQYAGIGG